MALKYCLFIMQPRDIQICIDSIRTHCHMDKVWLRAYTQEHVLEQMNKFVAENQQYDRFIITSDDVIINKKAIDTVTHYAEKYEVFTGYCNMFDGSEYVSVCKTPLILYNKKYSTRKDYNLMTQEEVNKLPDDLFNCGFAGFALSCFSRDIWNKFPAAGYRLYDKIKKMWIVGSSDHHVSYRLVKHGVPIMSHKEAFVYHLKTPRCEDFRGKGYEYECFGASLEENILVGRVEPTTTIERI